MRRSEAHAGFTLIEMMAVMLFTTIVITAAVSFYLDLNRAQRVAVERTRLARTADALLTRVARDIGTTALLKRPEGEDPLAHPWVFVAERRLPVAGADHLRFVRRGRERRGTDPHESDLETVSYALREELDGTFALVRWSSSQLGESLDKSFPDDESEGALLVADGIADFGIRFLNEEGGWQEEWDSSNVGDSNELPIAAEVAVAFESSEEFADPVPLVRQVWLPVRPVDLEAELEQAEQRAEADSEEEDGEDQGCITVAQCIERDPVAFEDILEDPAARGAVEALRNRCIDDIASVLDVDMSRCR